jgi:Putative sensor
MAAAAGRSDAWGMTSLLLRSGRETAYLTAGLLTSVLAFAVWIAAVTLSLSLALFVVGLPVMLASAIVFRWSAELDRRNAEFFLGRPVRGRYRDHRAATFFGRLAATFKDPQTWRDFSWLTVHSIVGFAFGVIAVSLVASVAGLAVLPVWSWALPDGVDFGLWNADTLPEACASAFLAIPLGVVTVFALRWMALAEAYLAVALLGPFRRTTARNG